MKFKIRHADKIVGVLIIVAIVSLLFVIFMIGQTQRWFSRNYTYKTYAQGALGLNKNMAVTCRGIAIGNVKDFYLTDDNRVEVIFTIQDQHYGRAKKGSLVEVLVSPIGMGGQFIFYPGSGGPLEEGAVVPMRDSPEAKEYLALGLAYIPPQEEPISDILEKLNVMIDTINEVFEGLNVKPGEEAANALGQSIASLQLITRDLANPNGIRRILNGESDALNAVEASLVSLSGTLDSVDQAMRYVPREMPQIVSLLSEARNAVQSANDVLISLKNNPLLKGGIPEHAAIDSSSINPRNIQF